MRVLLWHVDKFIVEVKEKALKQVPPLSPSEKKKEMGEGVVALITMEKGDDAKDDLIDVFLKGLKEYINQVKASRVMLYPYAHLSSELLNVNKSMKIFNQLVAKVKEELNKEGVEVYSSPFGWYKAFEVRVKGHPLSELSRKY